MPSPLFLIGLDGTQGTDWHMHVHLQLHQKVAHTSKMFARDQAFLSQTTEGLGPQACDIRNYASTNKAAEEYKQHQLKLQMLSSDNCFTAALDLSSAK